jgi:hypothetical protein
MLVFSPRFGAAVGVRDSGTSSRLFLPRLRTV